MIWILALACTPPDSGFGSGGTSNAPFPQDTSVDPDDSDSTPDSTMDSDSTPDSDSAPDSDSGGPFVPPGGEDCGLTAGDVACNLLLTDQAGADFALWDLYGGKVALVVGDGHNSNLVQASGWLQGVGDAQSAYVAVVLNEDANFTQPTTGTATTWANAYGLEHVLFDDSDADALDGWYSSQTKTFVIDQDMKIDSIITGYIGEEQLDDKLKDL